MDDALFNEILEKDFGASALKKINLSSSAKDKREALGYRDASSTPLKQLESFDQEGHSLIGDIAVQNKNKLYNSLTPEEQQQHLSDIYDQRIYTDEQSKKYQLPDATGTRQYLKDQEQRTSFLYGGTGKKDPNLAKFGIAKYGVEPRYTPGQAHREGLTRNRGYGWESGPEGIDPKSAFMNWELPQQTAVSGEGMIHGNIPNIEEARATYDTGTPEAAAKRLALGSGASEYYDSTKMPLMNMKAFGAETPKSPVVEKAITTTDPAKVDKLYKNMSRDERVKYNIEKYKRNKPDTDDAWSEAIDEMQSSASQLGFGVIDATMDAGLRVGRSLGLTNKQNADITLPFMEKSVEWHKDTANADKEFGVNTQLKAKEMARIDASWEKMLETGDIADVGNFIMDVGKRLPQLLGSSLPEMITIFSGVGLAAVVGKRVNDASEEYSKNNNGEQMPMHLIAGSAISNAVLLRAEKFLVKSGFAGAMDKMTTPVKKSFLKSFGNRVVGVATSAAGEYAQEGGEAVVEDWFTKNAKDQTLDGLIESVTSSETNKQAAIGSIMGGALRATGEAASIPKAAKAAYDIKKADIALEKTGKFMSKEDYEFFEANIETRNKSAEDNYKAIKGSLENLDKIDSFHDLENHPLEDIRLAAEAAMQNYKGISPGSLKHKQHISTVLQDMITKGGNTAQAVTNTLTKYLKIDVSKASKEEIDTAMENASIDTIDTLSKTMKTKLSPERAQKLDISEIKSENLEVTKSRMKEILGESLKVFDAKRKVSTTEEMKIKKGQEEAIKLREGDRKVSAVDTKVESKKLKESVPKRVLKYISGLTTNFDKAVTRLNQYSDQALDLAISDTETSPRLKKAIEKVKNERIESKKIPGLDFESAKPVIAKRAKTETRIGIVEGLSAALKRKEITDTRDRDITQEYLDTAIEKGYITENAAKTYQKRLDKIASGAKEPDEAQLAEEAEEAAALRKLSGEAAQKVEEKTIIKVEDVREEAAELEQEMNDLSEELEKLNKKDELTKDQTERKVELDKILKQKMEKAALITKDLLEFAKDEMELNERYSAMEGVPVKLGQLNPNEFFTKDELEFLDICKD